MTAGRFVTPLQVAQRFVGVEEAPGIASNPHVLAMLKLDAKWVTGDDVPWCSAFVNYIAWILGLPRSKSLAARSWLKVGDPIDVLEAEPGDVVILQRGDGVQPGPDVLDAPGHVGFFVRFLANGRVELLGGNQSDEVNVQSFPVERVLGVRRLA
jgi:uncharacterized protein (TIGR02594 family)